MLLIEATVLFIVETVPFKLFVVDVIDLVPLCQEALHREQMLEQKLATLQRLLANTQEASESSWQVGNGVVIWKPYSGTPGGANIMHRLFNIQWSFIVFAEIFFV